MDSSKFRGYWNLDEAANNDALDSTTNGLHLTQTFGTIDAAEGGRDFEAGDTEYFTRPGDDALLSFGDEEMTFGCWVKLESQAAAQAFLSKYDAGSDRAYSIGYDNSIDRYIVQFDDDGLGATTGTANTYGAVPATTWAFVVGYHDPATDTIGISVDGGAANTIAHAGGIFNNAEPFQIGRNTQVSPPYFDGIMKSAFVYAGLFSASDLALIYNGGTPLKWTELLAKLIRGNPQVIII